MLLNKLLYCAVKNGWCRPYGLSLCLIPTSEPVQTVICISKIQKTKGIVQRNSHRWTTYSESCLLIFFGVCAQKCPASTIRCSQKFARHFRLWIKCFFIKVQMLNGRIMFVGYNWYQTPHSLTMPLLFILLTQKLQVGFMRMPPKLKHYFLMSWTSLFRNTKEYSLLISFKNGLYGKNASFKDGIPFPNQLARNKWCSHSHVHSDNPISIIFWITTTLRIVCQLTWGMKLSLFVSTPASWQFFKGPKKNSVAKKNVGSTQKCRVRKSTSMTAGLFSWGKFAGNVLRRKWRWSFNVVSSLTGK